MNAMWRLSALVLLMMGLLAGVVGCAVEQGRVYVKDGRRYGVISDLIWRGGWWQHYERGVSYAAGEFWDDAIGDFRAAMEQRDADQRDARTYGLHFVDYFPHRELGIVYYRQGQFQAAIEELETSLASADNAKAKLYLNRARRERLKQTQRDRRAPRITIDTPGADEVTNRFTITVAGRVEDDTYVAAITIQGRRQFVELAQPQVAFEQAVPLRDGDNTIDIVATDLLGKQTRQSLLVRLDRRGPLLSIDGVEVTGTPPHQRARVKGFLSDRSAITRFELAGQAMPRQTASEFEKEVPVPSGAVSLPFEVVDTAGNVTRGAIALMSPASAPVREGAVQPLIRWAALDAAEVMSDAGRPLMVAARGSRGRGSPPVIKVHDLQDRETIYLNRLYLTGEVRDAKAIVAFSIDGESLLGDRRPQQLFFGEQLPLQEGENVIRIEAQNQAGLNAERTVNVTSVLPPHKQMGSRLRVSLLPLVKKGTPSDFSEIVDELFFTTLFNQRRFDLVERQQLEKVLQELKLSQTELVDPATAAKVGRLVAAEGILYGKVIEKTNDLDIFVRYVDIETSLILAVVDVYDDVEGDQPLSSQRLRELADGLVWKIERAFPLVEGLVLAKENDVLFTDLVRKPGIREHMKLIVFREGKTLKHPITGKMMRRPGKTIGEARVMSVADDISEANLLSTATQGEVRQLDKVMTK